MPVRVQITRIESGYASSWARFSSPRPEATISSSSSVVSRRITGSIVRTARVRNHGSTTPRSASCRPGSPSSVNGSTAHMKSSAMWCGPLGSHGDGSRENALSRFRSTRMTSA